MITVITIHFIIIFLLVFLVLLQNTSKGMIGGGSSNDVKNILSKEDSKNILSRLTKFLAISFFISSLLLAVLSISSQKSKVIIDDDKVEIPVS